MKSTTTNHSMFPENDNLLKRQGAAFLTPAFFSAAESDQYLNSLMNHITWTQEPIRMFGKSILQPRLTALYGDAGKTYQYSGITMSPFPWTAELLEIKERVEAAAGTNFTTALLNQYRNGSDSMGWHRDNEKELGLNPVIASVSFGAARKFQMREYQEKKNPLTIELGHGSLLLMQGETQHYWEHQLPKTKQVKRARVNITFRRLL